MSAVTDLDEQRAPFSALVARLVIAAGLVLVLVGFAGAVIAALGGWTPLVGSCVIVVAAAVAWRLSRALPVLPVAKGGAAAVVLAAAAITVWTGVTHSEQILPRRDSASYLQSSINLAEGGTRPIPIDVESVGGPDVLRIDGVGLESPAFYQIGSASDPAIQPQFMPGPSVWYSVAYWLGGERAAFWAPAIAGGFALVALGLLVCAFAGRWSGALAVILIGACFPWLHTSRSTYSEPLAALALAAGFYLLTAVTRSAEEHRVTGGVPIARAAVLAGFLIGGTSIVRIDALRETMLLVPIGALLLARQRGWARHTLTGAIGSTAAGFVIAAALSWRYLGEIAASLIPLVGLTVLTGLVSWWVLRRGWSLPDRVRARLPLGLAVTTLLVGVFLASRPLWLTVRQNPRDPGAMYVARMQEAQGLTVDGGRTYAEHSVQWLSWWVGPIALVIALITLAVLNHRMTAAWVDRGRLPAWSPVVLIATGSTLLTLWRPGITPDHPWADRRLLIALPLVLCLVAVAVGWVVKGERRAPFARWPALGPVIAAALVLATAIPTALATWPHRSERIELGELAAVREVCDRLGPNDVVIAVDDWAVNQWPQVVRGMCGRPALATEGRLRDDPARLHQALVQIDQAVTERGGTLLLIASREEGTLTTIGARDIQTVVDVTVWEDMRVLEERPDGVTLLPIQLWSGRVDPTAEIG